MAFSPQELAIIEYGVKNGKTKFQVMEAISNSRAGVIPQRVAPVEPGFLSRVGTSLKGRFEKASESVAEAQAGIQSPLSAVLQTTGQIAGAVFDPLTEAVSTGLKATGLDKPLGAVVGAIAETAPVKGLIDYYKGLDPEAQKNVDAVFNIGSLIPAGMLAKPVAGAVKAGAKTAVKTISDILPPPPPGGTFAAVSETALNAAKDLRSRIQLSIAKKNVDPKLEASTRRLFLEGTKRLEDPIATSDRFYQQSLRAVTDTKLDPAIAEVGTRMGTAFETVIRQRQAVGKTIGDELKTIGNVPINVAGTKSTLFAELADGGLSYNPRTNKFTAPGGTKFAPDEVSMLNTFTKDVIALGDNPTVSAIDNFIARTRATLAFTKGKTGVFKTTNAERIINGQIARLRESLNPAVNGNPALAKYWDANKTYSDLSDFVKEGATFLGKKTQSGDYAKDASVAKSAVQSILNQGKKDWMIQLEALTGYRAVDEAVLALQAMKDAGDFRGLSLLQAMSESGLPMSQYGLAQKIIDFALEKGGRVIAGTPAEQTRAFLQSLKTEIPQTTIKPTKTTPATTGASTKKIIQSKSSETVISKSVPPKTKVASKVSPATPTSVPTTAKVSPSKLAEGFDSVLDVPLAVPAQKMSLANFKKEYGFYFEGDTSKNYYRGTADEFYNDVKGATTPSPASSAIAKGQVKITDPTKFERAKDLSPTLRKLETRAFNFVLKNEDAIIAAHKAKFGKTVNADDFRPFLKQAGYTDGRFAAGVQEPSSYLAKRARTEALKNPGDFVIGTAGGSGVGKTSAADIIPSIKKLNDNAAMILDSNFSSIDSAHKFINEASAAGKEFIGVFTYRDFIDSITNGVVKRMLTNKDEMGRLVPTKVVAGNHIGSWEVIQQLVDEGVDFRFIDNSLGPNNAVEVSFKELKAKIKYPSKEELTKIANEEVTRLYKNRVPFEDRDKVLHYISKEQYQGLLE